MADPTASLPPALAEYRQAFQSIKATTSALINPLSPDQFNRRPAPGRWSVGECFSHLTVAGAPLATSMRSALEEARDNERKHGSQDVRHGLLGRFFIYLLQPDSPIDMPSPPGYEPAHPPLNPEQVKTEFLALQDQFIGCIDMSAGLNVNRVRVRSPFSPLIRFRVGTWLEATLAHEQRHLVQAQQALPAVGIDRTL